MQLPADLSNVRASIEVGTGVRMHCVQYGVVPESNLEIYERQISAYRGKNEQETDL